MSLTGVARGRGAFALMLAAAAAAVLLAAGAFDAVLAQGAPFAAPRTAAPPPQADGVIGWIFAKQAEFYQNFSRIIRAAKTDGTAVWTLLGVSFL
jgi:nickel/cobalt transporter (NicO) family protein